MLERKKTETWVCIPSFGLYKFTILVELIHLHVTERKEKT